jgi:Cdc6-like AAA superfamily ATPase
MSEYAHLKKEFNQYASLSLPCNPFTIAPLFRSFKDVKKCEQEERLFVIPQGLSGDIQTLLRMQDRRALIYGLYGVGKTSLVDFILYLAYNFHKRFCLRVVITEDNVERAIHEMLLAVCFEILAEISTQSLLHPITAIRKWLVKNRRSDFIMENILKLMGNYTESHEQTKTSKRQGGIKGSLGVVEGNYSFAEELAVRKSIQSYVEILSMRKVADYLEDFVHIVQQLGFRDIVVYIDEADHLSHLDQFLSMLTRAREVLFSSGYTFFVAGSVEIAKYTESLGAIFDKLVFTPPADYVTICEILDMRVRDVAPHLHISDVFLQDVLEIISQKTHGVRKNFLRLAENALDVAANSGSRHVTAEHIGQVISAGEDKVSATLKESHIRVLQYLGQHDLASASHQDFQRQAMVKRVQLRNILEELFQLGYVRKQTQGKSVYYQISSQYKPYFQQTNQ